MYNKGINNNRSAVGDYQLSKNNKSTREDYI